MNFSYIVNAIQIDLEVRLTPAPRDNDEEALLTFIEDQFVFDQVQKTDHINQIEEELAEDEFKAKVFLNSIIVGKTIQYTFLLRSFSVLFFHLRLPNKSSNFLLGISISSRVFSGLEIKESTFWKKNMMTENTLLFNLLLWWSFLGELNQKLALKSQDWRNALINTQIVSPLYHVCIFLYLYHSTRKMFYSIQMLASFRWNFVLQFLSQVSDKTWINQNCPIVPVGLSFYTIWIEENG